MNTTDVLAEINANIADLIAHGNFGMQVASLIRIRDRIAALVEAAREINSELLSSGHDGSAPGGGCSLCDAGLKLSAALKGFGNG